MSWMTYATDKVEVHLDAPDGPLFAEVGLVVFPKILVSGSATALSSICKMFQGPFP